MGKILIEKEASIVLSEIRLIAHIKKRIVLCHGVFDVVHPGHLEHLESAKKFGDVLVVGVTADKYVNKGPDRPLFDEIRRAAFLAALEIVDYVYIVHADSAIPAIQVFKPDFYVKGPDYKDNSNDITGKIDLERAEVERFGGQIAYTEGFTSSSTMLINNHLTPKESVISSWRDEYKKAVSLTESLDWIDRLSQVDVNVLGETIIDAYTSCKPLAKSSKDPILAFHRFTTQKFLGGVLAIADSSSNWSRSTSVTSVGGTDLALHLREINKDTNFKTNFILEDVSPTILKHRFFDMNSGNRVFEYYNFNPEDIKESTQGSILQSISEKLRDGALFLVADYGHGFFTDQIIDKLCKSDLFLAVNTQANAGNRGFNTFAKYPKIDFLCLNGGELELELRKKDLDYSSVVPSIMKEKGCRNVVVTLGGEGLLVFDANGGQFRTPALAAKIVDKVGAGDSVLAIASMLSFLGAPKEVIGLLASVVAAFEVSQLGHKNAIDTVSLKKSVKGLLG